MSYNTDSRAPSISLWYNDSVKGDILTQDIYVPASGVTKQTYYCCLQWNSGRNGGGYCGMQDHARGRNYIFSLWDPEGVHQPIKPVFEGPGTICEPFGGEGTGLKSWNFELRWEPDHWYTFVLRRWDEAGHTYYGLWIKHQMMCRWTHFVTLDFPLPDIYFDSWTCSFLEDWQGTGNNERRVHFKNGYKRSKDGKWVAFDKGAFNVVREESSQKYEENFDCGMFEDTYFLQSGGVTIHNDDLCEGTEFGCKMVPQPDAPPIRCYLTAVKNMFILWDVPIGNVPQFKYTVKVDGTEVKSEVNSETRACQLENKPEETVELIVEDIYGRTAQIKFDIKGDKEICDDDCATSESSM